MQTTFRLFNSLGRTYEDFRPLSPDKIRLYCCGPTVYLFQHIGNFKTFLFEDVLVRALRFAGHNVEHVMNITDVGHLVGDGDEGEDKMLVAARKEKKKSFEIAEFYTNRFFEDWDKLRLVRPSVVCKATDHIQEMIDLIIEIEAKGCAYVANGNVYFDVEKFSEYGKLANLDLEKLRAGARIEVDEHKHSPFDFVLWFTKSKFENQELQWESPWGQGYPGWHIECSAMAMKYLGPSFDIHCGGIDHIPVHHTNEIAQSEAATGKPFVKYWLHSEFLTVDGEKMSKSKGNLYLIEDIEKRGMEPLVFRYLALSSHYRTHLNFSWEAMTNASNSYQRLKRQVIGLREDTSNAAESFSKKATSHLQSFAEALADDLNTPKALAVVWKLLDDGELTSSEKLGLIYRFDEVLGLGASEWSDTIAIPEQVSAFVVARQEARKAKNWAESDRLRDEIQKLGYSVEDKGTESKVRKL